jgi:hypothetical protein
MCLGEQGQIVRLKEYRSLGLPNRQCLAHHADRFRDLSVLGE